MVRAREYTNVGALTWADLGTLSDPCYLVEVAANWVVYLAIYVVFGNVLVKLKASLLIVWTEQSML